MQHSAEWLRGAIHVAKDCEEPVAVAYYTKLIAAAESRESGEPSTECLMQILRDGQADHWAATCGSDEGGFQPSEWVLEAEKVLAGEYSGSSLADQLAAAKSEREFYHEATEERRALVRRMDVLMNGEKGAAKQASLCDIVAQFPSWLAARDARMKALGAAEWLRGYLTGLFNMQPEEYKGAALKPLTDELTRLESEAARLAEG